MEVEITDLASRHCVEVAQLHLRFLRSRFKGKPGQELLRIYYKTLVEKQGGCGYVAEENASVIGYVCGVWEASLVHSLLLRKHWPKLLIWGIAQSLLYPTLITTLFGQVNKSSKPDCFTKKGYELRPIVVIPQARGTGVASKLVETILADAATRGFQRVHLFTETDNVVARSFYCKEGFDETGILNHSGISSVRYERSLR